MSSDKKEVKYADYKEGVMKRLADGRTWEKCGVWVRDGKCTEKPYILPLKDEKNNPENRAEAIKHYLNFDCTPYLSKGNALVGLHQYAHHLNSSQLLCLMFFSKLIDRDSCATKDTVEFMKKAFHIDIHVGAKCDFEYKESKADKYRFVINRKREYEGTSFDFHIVDGDVEVFFEIKFTEDGFGNAENDDRHRCKAAQYKELLPQSLKDKVEVEDIMKYYQLFRNIIRADNENKYVVFITDGNNPSTKAEADKDKDGFMKKFGKYLDLNHVKFKTWQDLGNNFPKHTELPFQFKAIL